MNKKKKQLKIRNRNSLKRNPKNSKKKNWLIPKNFREENERN